MAATGLPQPPRVACDAMFGGVARWLRVFGVDASFTPGIDDGELAKHALAEGRIVVSSDGPLFERRLFTTGQLHGLRVPIGLKLLDQLRFVVRELELHPCQPRCSACNGELAAVSRAEVGDVVPARSLIWRREFFRCVDCDHVFWEGSHWRRIHAVRGLILSDLRPDLTPPGSPSDNGDSLPYKGADDGQ